MEITTFAIFTTLKFEHSYINQFIEHHLNLGFNFFYLIVDNLDPTHIQNDYNLIIKDEFKSFVKLYNMSTDYYIQNTQLTIHDYFISYFNNTILQDIKEDWVLVLGCDSFMYFDGDTVHNYVKNLNSNIFQISFPMYMLYNLNNINYDDLCHTLNNYYTIPAMYMYSMARVNNIKCLDRTSHYFLSTSNDHVIYLPDNKNINIHNNNINFDELLCKSSFNIFDINHTNFFAFHFYFRCYDELIIKDLLYWNLINNNKKQSFKLLLLDCINEQKLTKEIFLKNNYGGSRIKHIMSLSEHLKLNNITENFNIINFKNFNNEIYNTELIENILKEINISKEEYKLFIDIVHKYIKK